MDHVRQMRLKYELEWVCVTQPKSWKKIYITKVPTLVVWPYNTRNCIQCTIKITNAMLLQ